MKRAIAARLSFSAALALLLTWGSLASAQRPAPSEAELRAQAQAALPQLSGTLSVPGLREPVEVLRDTWGIPHIYARNTEDLFFAQGFVVAQDRMWQLEMWRRNGEGKLAEILGPQYVTRDKFARLLQYRGDWEQEFRKYHPEGRRIFDSFAAGVNAAIRLAIQQNKVPVEFDILGFRPEPVWTAQTLVTRMPGWTLTRNASTEVSRAINVRNLGADLVEQLTPTRPEKEIVVPEGLDLSDITPEILNIAAGANNIRWSLRPDLGSNNWVIGGSKSTTGMPIIANDPHREVVNPALRYIVHLNAPGWNALGATEPGLPGITIGHNDRIGWGFTILGMDQQDLYVEETEAANANRYLYQGRWYDMQIFRETISVKGAAPVVYEAKYTRHGPVLHEDRTKNRAYALKWVGSEPGGAGYLGSLNVLQARSWDEFNAGIAKSWYIPSHSLVYGDVEGNIGYRGVAYTPIRRGWDGLLPVPGKDGRYEWQGHVPYDELPLSFNRPEGYYASANNDVVPHIVPGYDTPLGFEYSASDRFDRITEVLSEKRKFSLQDMENLQEDAFSIRARELVPLLRGLRTEDPEVRRAIDRLLAWDYVIDRNATAPTIFEYWVLRLPVHASRPRLPEAFREGGPFMAIERVIPLMKAPDAAYGATQAERNAARDRILLASLKDGIEVLKRIVGPSFDQVRWGQIHTADFVHPLAHDDATRRLFGVQPVPRSGSAVTVLATSGATAADAKQQSGASFKFVFDTQDWDRSTGLSTPGQSAQPLSPHYADLAPLWGDGNHFPLVFSRAKVEEHTKNRLRLEPSSAARP